MKKYKNLKMIVCVGKDNIIGAQSATGNGLLWKIKEELLYFKSVTIGHTLLFGANTAKYVPVDLMKKDREVIILRSSMNIKELLDKLSSENKTIFVCGGKKIYEYFLENFEFDEIYLSVIKDHINIDACDTPLYLPKLENYGYKVKSKKDFKDFEAYILSK